MSTNSNELASGSWNKIYYALGAFAVLSTGTAVYLSDVLLDRYAESVEVNQEWAERSASYSTWGSIAAEGNAPGNDVFESGDVAGESTALDEIVVRFDAHREQLLADLDHQVGYAEAQLLRTRIQAADKAFQGQVQEAREIFAAFAQDREEAGRHMASMDRFNAQTAVELGLLAKEIQAIQAELFASQLASAGVIRSYELGLIGLVVLMVLFTVAYGQKLSAIFRDAQVRVARRNQDLSLVLDNVAEGLAVVSLEGQVSAEASAVFVDLLGAPDGTQTLWSLIEARDPGAAIALELGFESLVDDIMPHELVLAQMPSRLKLGSRTVQLELRPIERAGVLHSVLVVAQDITAQLQNEAREARQAEMLHLFNRIMHDRHGIEEFTQESAQLVQAVLGGQDQLALPVARRLIHTLKGNAGFFGLKRLAESCHAVEDRIEEEGVLSAASVRTLSAAWAESASMIRHLLGDVETSLIEVEPEELTQALRLAEELEVPRVARALRSWQHERLAPRLERIQDQVSSLATRLEKQVRVEIDSGVRRLNTRGWESFWSSLTHILRNAIDHGIEAPEERARLGKPEEGTISLRASRDAHAFVLEIADDGRGIDWEALGRKAREGGLPAESRADLQRALFTSGISTADTISDISGRGVGMGAIVEMTRSLGGQVGVSSEPGRGTCFRFELPLSLTVEDRQVA